MCSCFHTYSILKFTKVQLPTNFSWRYNFFLVFSCLWEDSITQFFSKHVTGIESIKRVYNHLNLKEGVCEHSASKTSYFPGQAHRKTTQKMIPVLGMPKDSSSPVLGSVMYSKGRCFKIGEAVIDTLSTVLPASNHLQLSGPDLVFTYIIYPNGFFFCMNLSPFETMYTLSICIILWQGTQEFNNEEIKNQLLSCICHLLASLDFWFLHWRRPWKPNSFPLQSSRFHRLLPFLHCFVSSGIPKY